MGGGALHRNSDANVGRYMFVHRPGLGASGPAIATVGCYVLCAELLAIQDRQPSEKRAGKC